MDNYNNEEALYTGDVVYNVPPNQIPMGQPMYPYDQAPMEQPMYPYDQAPMGQPMYPYDQAPMGQPMYPYDQAPMGQPMYPAPYQEQPMYPPTNYGNPYNAGYPPVPPQPVYVQTQVNAGAPDSPIGVASLIISILAICSFCAIWSSVPLALLALVLGLCSLPAENHGSGTAGIVLSLLTLGGWILVAAGLF